MLKPRRHVLVEPNARRKSEFKDLLSHPNNTYSFLRNDPIETRTIARLFNEGYLPEQEADAIARPSHAPNPNLLVLANLARLRLNPQLGSPLFAQLLGGYADGTSVNRYGAVRIITVINNDYVESLLPKTLVNRRRLQGVAEGVARIIPIVRNDSYASKLHLKGLETIERSAHRVAERMKQAGITSPSRREPDPLELAPVPIYVRDFKTTVEYCPRPKLPWHEEYIKYDATFMAGKKAPKKDSERYKRYVQLRRNLLYENRQAGMVKGAVGIQAEIDAVDEKLRKLKAEHQSGIIADPELIKALKKLVASRQKSVKQLKDVTSSMGVQPLRCLDSNVDEARCFTDNGDGKSEPLLEWDRRPYEPFKALPEDFNGPKVCAILDIHPDPSAPVLQAQKRLREQGRHQDSEAITQIWFHLCRLLFSRSKAPLSSILGNLFPTVPVHELVNAIPALQRIALVSVDFQNNADGTPVAHLHYKDNCLDGAAYRTISTATLWAIAEHWHGWPFKAVESEELFKILGGGAVRTGTYKHDNY